MEILVVAPEYPPLNIGGGGHVIEALTEGLEKQGHRLTILSAAYDSRGLFDRPRRSRSGETNVIWLPLLPAPDLGFQLKSYLPPNLFSAFELLRQVIGGKYDVIHIHGFGHIFCDLAAALSKLGGKPYIYTIHGFPKEPGRRGGPLGVIYGFYTSAVGRPLVQGASKIVAVSKALADECTLNLPGRMIDVIHNGIDPTCSQEPPAHILRQVTEKFGLQGKQVILGLGRICEAKGFQYAIRALPRVLERFPRAHLVIAGSDDGYGYLGELRRLTKQYGVEANVSFVGKIEDVVEKNALLWSSSVVVIPTLEETFGLVATEALGSGRPIVASNVGGLPEILSGDEYSLLVESRDDGGLAEAIISLMGDMKIQRGAWQHREKRLGVYDLDHMAAAYSGLYSTIGVKAT